MKKDNLSNELDKAWRESSWNFVHMMRWILLAIIVGLIVGAVSAAFSIGDKLANTTRNEHFPITLLLLPVAGLFITYIYQHAGEYKVRGTNLLLTTLRAQTKLPVRMAPLIFVSTILTHLCGGSVGREGAALQLGGALGSGIGQIPFLKLDDGDKRMVILCGMSAAFSAIFGTPIAAVFFPIEFISIGIIQYSAILPCFFASVTAGAVAAAVGIEKESFDMVDAPDLSLALTGKVFILSICVAIISIAFCLILKNSGKVLAKIFPSPYIRVVAGGLVFIIISIITVWLGIPRYMGAGMDIIEKAVKGDVYWFDFILKILLTALCIGSGYKGGEIVPSLFVGATFGAAFAGIADIPVALGASCGMAAMFCGVTNCPVTTLLIVSELFGFRGASVYFLQAIAVSYVMSGYFGLYSEQKIVYSKFRTQYIDRKAGALDISLEEAKEK